MEPKNNIPDFDLDAFDLEVFSNTFPQKKAKKHSFLINLLDKTFVKTVLTLALLLFLFGSTFFIASRIKEPSFTTSSADIGYIPQAQINLPEPIGIKACSEVSDTSEEQTFLQSFCAGEICIGETEKEACESIDVLLIENGVLSEVAGQDGISDCVWIEEEVSCKPKY